MGIFSSLKKEFKESYGRKDTDTKKGNEYTKDIAKSMGKNVRTARRERMAKAVGGFKEQFGSKRVQYVDAKGNVRVGMRTSKYSKFHKAISNLGNRNSGLQRRSRKGVVRYVVGGGAITIRPPAVGKGGYSRTGRVGRPKASFTKYRDPRTGRPMHVWAYRKLISQLKRQEQGTALQVDNVQVMQLARRGIPPEQARIIINSRQIQQAMAQQQYPPQIRQQFQQPQQFQSPQMTAQQIELERIRNMVPWARATAMRQLMQRNRIEQIQAQQQQQQHLQTEVSLLDGRTRVRDNPNLRRERWTYS